MSKKNKLTKLEKKIEKDIQRKRDEVCMDYYGKPEAKLAYAESVEFEKLYKDYCNLIWKLVNQIPSHPVEINQVGQVRDPVTKEPCHIYCSIDSGYPYIYMGGYLESVHRLVARAFVDNPDPETKTQINHIDGVKTHNWWRNLEWVTPAENVVHAIRTGLISLGEDRQDAKYTNEQIRHVCQLLQDHPDWSFRKIEELTDVNHRVIRQIYDSTSWKSISSKYDFIPRDAQPRGENAPTSSVTDDQIRQVCQLLQDRPDLSFVKITELTGVNKDIISSVYRGKTWVHIAKDYKFCEHTAEKSSGVKNTPETIKQVCEMLQNNSEKSFTKIAEELGVSRTTVVEVYNRKQWTDISNRYRFAPRTDNNGENNGMAKFNAEQAEQVCKLLDDKYTGVSKLTNQQIADQVGVSLKCVEHISAGHRWKDVAKNHPFYKAKFGN